MPSDSEGLRKLGRPGQGYGGRHAAAPKASRQAFGAAHTQTARVRQELDAVRAARKGDAVDGSKLERGPIVLDKPDAGDEKTIDSID